MCIPVLRWTDNKLKVIDQTALPWRLEFLYLDDVNLVWNAIKNMKVRGAPAIGVLGAFGVYFSAKKSKADNCDVLREDIKKAAKFLKTSRPTAVNLFWAVDRMQKKAFEKGIQKVNDIKKSLLKEAKLIMQEDKKICRDLGKNGAVLIRNGSNILTHCNAGALATVDYGTALGIFYSAKGQGKKFCVYVDETRPRLQGARLTAWELKRKKIPFTLICDNTAGFLMSCKKIDRIIVGADRIASNGDTANKIGTYSLAVLARYHGIPFHIAAPVSTFDLSISKAEEIVIEERNPEEILSIGGHPVALSETKVFNPAFDITNSDLITSIITEKGIIKPPYKKNIKTVLS